MILKVAASFLILIFCCQLFEQGVITICFYANQKYIAANLCENRNMPQMHCNGTCQLHKKLNQDANKDKQNPERRNEGHNEVSSSKTFFAQLNLPIYTNIKKQYSIFCCNNIVDKTFQFFHPPQHFM